MHQQPTIHHPEAPDGKGWLHVAVKQSPPPPPSPPPPAFHLPLATYPIAAVLLVLLGYLIAGETHDWRLQQSERQTQQLQQQNQQLQQDKARYCQGGGQ